MLSELSSLLRYDCMFLFGFLPRRGREQIQDMYVTELSRIPSYRNFVRSIGYKTTKRTRRRSSRRNSGGFVAALSSRGETDRVGASRSAGQDRYNVELQI
jgi:hypothetical protein